MPPMRQEYYACRVAASKWLRDAATEVRKLAKDLPDEQQQLAQELANGLSRVAVSRGDQPNWGDPGDLFALSKTVRKRLRDKYWQLDATVVLAVLDKIDALANKTIATLEAKGARFWS